MTHRALPTDYQKFIHISRYARWDESLGRRETWEETVGRYFDFIQNKLEANNNYLLSSDLREELQSAVLNLEIMPSMRALMTAGPALERDNIAGYNCSYLPINSVRSFDEVLYVLMCGTGVGFSVERQFVSELPVVNEHFENSPTTIIVNDSKAGWARSLRELIAMLYAGQIPSWDVSKVRPAGARLKTFGGRASGPGPLEDLFRFSIRMFQNAAGRKLTSIECHDLVCKIADIVVVGGVRRSALISLSNLTDDRMRHAKSGAWWEDNIQRSLANNSVCYTEKPEMTSFMEEWLSLYQSKSGERGIFNRESAKKQVAKNGRRDPEWDFGTNPCCFVGSTLIHTVDGPRRIDEIDHETHVIVDGKIVAASKPWSVGIKPTYRLHTDEGFYIEITGEHKFETSSGAKVEAQDLVNGQRLNIHNHRSMSDWVGDGTFEHGLTVGHFLGDGTANYTDPRGYVSMTRLAVYDGDGDVLAMKDALSSAVATLDPPRRSDASGWRSAVNNRQEHLSIRREWVERYVALEKGKYALPSVEETSGAFHRGFLRGLFDTDGHIEGTTEKGFSVRLGQSNLQTLQIAQRMLLRLGIKSVIRDAKNSGICSLPDGKGGLAEYETKRSFRLIISSSDVVEYANKIGFTHSDKIKKLNNVIETLESSPRGAYKTKFVVRFSHLEPLGEQEVYDMEARDERHVLDANGFVASNSEIILRPYQFCNLTEVVVRAEDTKKSLEKKVRLATILGTFQSTLTDFKYLRKIWKENTEEERLLGVSLTGIMDNTTMNGRSGQDELKKWLNHFRQTAVDTNKQFAESLDIPQSTSITCVKPSGTVSQLVDSASGIHARHSEYYIRRVRGDRKDPLTQFMVDAGIPCEDDVTNPENIAVFSFPMKSPEGAVLRDDMSALEQLELWKAYQIEYTEHKPSVTISVRDNEWMGVGSWVWDNFDYVSGVSFLPHSDHTYRQAPYEDIDKETYNIMLADMPVNIGWETLAEYECEDNTEGVQTLACSSGACEIVDVGVSK
jgi:ribonucleotide reductase, class II